MQNSRKQKQAVVVAAGYLTLVKKIRAELANFDLFVKNRATETQWTIGKFINEHLLENKQRAGYGQSLYQQLAKDVDRSAAALLRAVQFYRVYPILAARRELAWGHYKALITVKDKEQRKKLEEQIIRKKWDTRQLQEYLNIKRELEDEKDSEKPAAQLKFTRGKLNTFGIIEPQEGAEPLLDLGFRVRKDFPSGKSLRLKPGDCVQITGADNTDESASFTKTTALREELFTYRASIDKIVDADTLLVSIILPFGISIQQRLRLRGINCPEMDTTEGKEAKRFVESRLKDLKFITIKTHKDTADKYDRYLADIFYGLPAGQAVPAGLEEAYLNQELLSQKLAVLF